MQRDKKQSIINQLKVKFMNIDFEYEEDDIQSKGDAIIKALQELNFEERGHQIKNYLDEYPSEIAVTNINVPSIADCRELHTDSTQSSTLRIVLRLPISTIV